MIGTAQPMRVHFSLRNADGLDQNGKMWAFGRTKGQKPKTIFRKPKKLAKPFSSLHRAGHEMLLKTVLL